MSRLVAEGLAVALGGRQIVDGVSMAVGAGEIVGLLGPNGAGKTTCFYMITGLQPPDAGTVQLDGQPLRGPLHQRVRQGLGYLPQRSTIFRGMNVRDHLMVPLGARRRDFPRRAQRREEADRLLRRVGIEDRARQPASRLSGGERRRLEIARVLACAPRVLLLDEPFAGVDPLAVADLAKQIRALAEEGLSVLITDHAVREAMGVCDRVVLLDEGRVLVAGTPREIAAHPGARARWLGENFTG